MRRVMLALLNVLSVTLPISRDLKAQARGVTERDSSGVRIVIQQPAARVTLPGAAHYKVDGSENGREPFFRLQGVIALADGFVVANAGTSELRFYDRDGLPRAVAGRRGGGPGEFQFLSWIQGLSGDSVAAYDARLRRVSVWSPDGRHVRDLQLALARDPPAAGAIAVVPPSPLGILPDGAILHVGSVAFTARGPGLQRAVGTLFRTDPRSERRDTITQLAVMDYQPAAGGGGPPTRLVVFPRTLTWSISNSGFAVSEGAEYRIDLYLTTGRPVASIRVARAPVAVTSGHRDAWLAERSGERPPHPVFPSVFPAYSQLWYDRAGRLWAELFRPPTVTTGAWDVFDSSGRLLVTVQTPSAVRLVAADATRVYGIHTDELDVQTIQAFAVPVVLTGR